jgi:hypothetical protein
VKRVALLLLLSSLVAGASRSARGQESGAPSPNAAIEQFLAAAKSKDLAAMAAVWGTAKGPASKSMNKKELERREFIMIECLPHEKATLGPSGPGEGGRLRIPVELVLLNHRATPAFTVVLGPKKRWYVENLEIDQLRDQGFCGAASSAHKPEGPPAAR